MLGVYIVLVIDMAESGAARAKRDIYSHMQKYIYYLKNLHTGLRLGYYKTRTGARIAQRQRNTHLGFRVRIERIALTEFEEAEQCVSVDQGVITATWIIEEDTVEIEELE